MMRDFRFLLFLFSFNLIFSWKAGANEILPLNKGWTFKNTKKADWKPATVPGVVHLDLLDNGLIKDPYVGNNEEKQRWIEFEDWEYKTNLLADSALLENKHIELVFEGLDTYTTILLNGKEVGTADNMFRTWVIDVKPALKPGNNELRLIFHSPLNLNKSNVENSPYELPAANETVDLKVSPYVRKAAYHFGWDWGPRFVTAGIWRPVYLRTWNEAWIEDIHIVSELKSKELAQIDLTYEVYSDRDQSITYTLNLDDKQYTRHLNKGKNIIKQSVKIINPKIWNPINYGNQNGYKAQLTLWKNNEKITAKEQAFYIRKIQLVNNPDAIGTSFYFKVNDAPFFAKGAQLYSARFISPESGFQSIRKVDPASCRR